MKKETEIEYQSKVWDAENERYLNVTQSEYEHAVQVTRTTRGAWMIALLGLKYSVQHRIYAKLGLTRDEWFDQIGVARRTAYRQLEAADHIYDSLPVDIEFSPEYLNQLLNQEKYKTAGLLGQGKIREIGKHYDVKALLEKGEVTLEDGTVLDVNELVQKSTKDIAEQLKTSRKKYNAELSRVEEDRKKLKEELEFLQAHKENTKKKAERAAEIELKYGPKIGRSEDKYLALQKADKLLIDLTSIMGKLIIDEDDPEPMKNRLLEIRRGFHAGLQMLEKKNYSIVQGEK